MVATARWLINPSDTVWLVHRRVQLVWIVALTLWALVVRVGLRRGLFLPEPPKMLLLSQPQELESVLCEWRRVPQRQRLRPVEAADLEQQLDKAEEPIVLALSHAVLQDPALRPFLTRLEMGDPRQVRALSVLSLFEQQQERLPPALMAETVLSYDDLPWAATFSVQAQAQAYGRFICGCSVASSYGSVCTAGGAIIGSKTVVQCSMPSNVVVGWADSSLFTSCAP